MYDFEFVRPVSLADALTALEDEDAMPLAGGQTLLPSLKARLVAPSKLVSLAQIPELHGIQRVGADHVRLGAATRHADVASGLSVLYPALAILAGGIGDPAVRNRGTIGGSLANNDPAACYPAGLLGSDATVHTNLRDLPSDSFFDGLFTTVLDPGEIITAVTFRLPVTSHYLKFRQLASGFALVGVFYARYNDHLRVAVTGAGEGGVFRWAEAEKALAEGGPDALAEIGAPRETMLSDLHAFAEYRAALVAELTARCSRAAEQR